MNLLPASDSRLWRREAFVVASLAVVAAAAQYVEWQRRRGTRTGQWQQSEDITPADATPSVTATVTLRAPAARRRSAVLVPDNIQLCERRGQPVLLGAGNFGKVYKAKREGVSVALKVFSNTCSDISLEDVELLQQCVDDHIVRFLDIVQFQNRNLMLSEYCPGTDLWEALNRRDSLPLTWYIRQPRGAKALGRGKQIALDIAKGLAFLHSHRIVHFDLKTRNVLLGDHFAAKICDIGQARLMIPCNFMATMQSLGHLAWTAPEILMGLRCTEKVDIYSFGVILWELVTGVEPRRNAMRPVRAPEECPQAVADLIQRCMCATPEDRPGASEIVAVLSRQEHELGGRLPPAAPQPQDLDLLKAQSLGEYLEALVAWVHTVRGPACSFSYEDARCWDPLAEMPALYEDTLRQMQLALGAPDLNDFSSAPHSRVVTLVHACRRLEQAMVQHHPQLLRRMQASSLRSEGGAEPARRSFEWRREQHNILGAMRLSPTQRRELGGLHAEFVATRLKSIGDERKELVSALQTVSQPMGAEDVEYGGPYSFAHALETSERLKTNLAEENRLLCSFYSRTFTGGVDHSGVLTEVQEAHARVQAWPYMPDPVALTSTIAQQLVEEHKRQPQLPQRNDSAMSGAAKPCIKP